MSPNQIQHSLLENMPLPIKKKEESLSESCGCCDECESAEDKNDSCCDGENERNLVCCDDEGGCCGALNSKNEKDSCCEDSCCEDECCNDAVEEEADVETEAEISNDDSACMCCVKVLVNEPHAAVVEDFAEVAISILEAHMGTLRACCQALERYCVRRACCFVPNSAKGTATGAKSSDQRPEVTEEKKSSVTSDIDADGLMNGGLEKLQLEIRGMDCPSCIPKVERALTQLPSVSSITTDYFGGTAELRYDPEITSPAAIISYVARATGFSVKALSGDSTIHGAVITLPLHFSTIPPPRTLDGFDIRAGPDPHLIEISFPIHVDNPRKPCDVLQDFEPYGVRLAPASSENAQDGATRDLINVAARTATCAMLSIPVLVLAWAHLDHRPVLYGSISVGFTTLIQAVALPIISSAFRSIVFLHQADINVLVAVSTLIAYAFSVISFAFEVAGKPFATPFFETNALLVTFIFLGRTISAATRRLTGSALRELQKLQQNEVVFLNADSPPEPIDVRLLYYGDVIRILPDTRIATDGVVVSGSSDADESSVTGESGSVPKQPGSRLIAGTLNLGGTLDIRVTSLVHENSLSRISTLVKHAQSSSSVIRDISDKIAAVILPVASVSSLLAFLIWFFVGYYVRRQAAATAGVTAITYAIAILVMSCPCAIVLSLPVILSVTIRIGIREGVLFRSSSILERVHGIDVVAFDKTGTLTQGNFSVERVEILVDGAEWLINALVKDNKHPISQGVHRYLSGPSSTNKNNTITNALTDVVSIPGKGIKASLSGFPVLGGSADFTGVCDHPLSTELRASGLSVFTVTLAGQPIAFFGLVDTPQPEAKALVAELGRRGKEVIILSGDTPSAVLHLADEIGVPDECAHASCTPEDKDAFILELQAKGRKVCFVGDGTNDGPALVRADVGIAVCGGSDVAVAAANAVFLGNSELRRRVLAVLDIADAARVSTRLAIGWCLFYNVIAIVLASGMLVEVRIEPRWAGIGEVVSVVPVILVGLGLDIVWNLRVRKFRRA